MEDSIPLYELSESGSWAVDNMVGRNYADLLLQHIAATQSPLVFGALMREVVRHDRFGGIEVGFFHRISERALIR